MSGRWRYARVWRELFALSWRVCPGRTALTLAVKSVAAVTVAATALALRAVVDGIIDGDVRRAVLGATAAALAYAVVASLFYIDSLVTSLVLEPVAVRYLGPQVERDVASLEGLEHLERTDFLDRLTIVHRAAWELMYSAWNAVGVLFSALRLILLLTLLSTVSPWLLLLIGFAAVPLWLDQRGQHKVAKAETDTAEAFRLQRQLFTLATEAASGKEIRVAGAGEEVSRLQRAAWDEAARGRQRARFRAAGWKLDGWVLFTGGFVAGLVLAVDLAANGRASVGDLVLVITVAVTLRDAIQATVSTASTALSSGRVIEAYLWLREYVARHRATAGGAPVPAALRDGITLANASFTYSGTDRPAIAEVSCHLRAGSVVAIVGEFGSGKTTLVKLLCKFYRLDAGRIRIDGTDLSELDTGAWRERTSAAFQDFGRFHLPFAETVGIGDLDHLDDITRIGEAIEAADAQALVGRLPYGLRTQLGRALGGVELSEGQWQKTALARASMRTEPLLFVLDEPTASLDAPSEHAILERYMERARVLARRTGAITVVVSHRFSTVTGADQILVLDAGRIVEAGTHAELMALDGRYAHLYGIQATAYTLT